METAVAMDGKKVEIAKLPVEHAASTDGKDLIVSGWGRTWKEDFPNPEIFFYIPLVLKALRLECVDPAMRCPKYPKEANFLCVGHLTILLNSAGLQDSGGRKKAIFEGYQLDLSKWIQNHFAQNIFLP